jgi:hypothetical protein
MSKIHQRIGEAIDSSQRPYPQGGIYWDLGVLHAKCVETTLNLLKELAQKIKEENNLTYDVDTLIKENYE